MMSYSASGFSDCGGVCPVETVSWHMAALFAHALSEAEGRTNCYSCEGSVCEIAVQPKDCDGCPLPTEAEWEGAARCGDDTAFAGDDEVSVVAWCDSEEGKHTKPVAGKRANDCGLYDMSGNVAEWTNDWYGAYSSEAEEDYTGAATGSQRTFRGGTYESSAADCRSAWRGTSGTPQSVNHNIGFRVVRTLP